MDITLRDCLGLADSMHDYVEKFGIAISADKLEEKVKELQTNIKNIQAVAKRMADVSNIINRMLLQKKTVGYIDPYPTEYDHAVLRTKYPKEEESKIILDDIVLPIKYVEKESDIPINNLYYIKNINQYAINMAGLVIKGNLANIVEYQTHKSARCEYGIECKSFKKDKSCNYYHDSEDYIKLGIDIPENNIRNFTTGSWLFSRNRRPKTYFTRHVGSKDTLKYDLSMLKKIQYREEINNREGQLIHDLLIYMILHNQGFIERYSHWK